MGSVNTERLVELRVSHGYSQKLIAVTLKVAQPVVSRWARPLKFSRVNGMRRMTRTPTRNG